MKEVKKDETEVAITTECPSGAKQCLMADDGQQKFAAFDDSSPIGSPILTTVA